MQNLAKANYAAAVHRYTEFESILLGSHLYAQVERFGQRKGTLVHA